MTLWEFLCSLFPTVGKQLEKSLYMFYRHKKMVPKV